MKPLSRTQIVHRTTDFSTGYPGLDPQRERPAVFAGLSRAWCVCTVVLSTVCMTGSCECCHADHRRSDCYYPGCAAADPLPVKRRYVLHCLHALYCRIVHFEPPFHFQKNVYRQTFMSVFGANVTSTSRRDNFKLFIRRMKKSHDRALARPAARNRPRPLHMNCDRCHTAPPTRASIKRGQSTFLAQSVRLRKMYSDPFFAHADSRQLRIDVRYAGGG